MALRAWRALGASLPLLVGSGEAGSITFILNYDVSVPPAEQAVIDQAAVYWEDRIPSGEIFNVNVAKAALPGGLLGQASGYTSSGGPVGPQLAGTPTGGSITFASGVAFFVDPTPAENSEYKSVVSPTTYLIALSGSECVVVVCPAEGKFDLLTVALHELGHVLGWSSAFTSFTTPLQPSQTGNHWAYVFPVAPPLDTYSPGYFPFGSALLPMMEENAEEAGSVGGLPSHLDDQHRGDSSGLLADLDVMNETLQVSERILIANVDLDVLADAYGYTVVPEPTADQLRLAALLVLAACGAARWRAERDTGCRWRQLAPRHATVTVPVELGRLGGVTLPESLACRYGDRRRNEAA